MVKYIIFIIHVFGQVFLFQFFYVIRCTTFLEFWGRGSCAKMWPFGLSIRTTGEEGCSEIIYQFAETCINIQHIDRYCNKEL